MESVPQTPAPRTSAPHPDWPTHSFRAMGGTIALWLDHDDALRARGAFDVVEQLFRYAERTFSRFDPESELSRLNGQPGRAVEVSDLMWDLLDRTLDAAERTGGIFDPTLGRTIAGMGYDVTFERVGQGDSRRAPGSTNGGDPYRAGLWRRIERDEARQTVRLPEGAWLDFGGIAKGYTAELAADLLGMAAPALVDARGDIVAAGAPRGLAGWPVAIAYPADSGRDGPAAFLWMSDGALATSGVDRHHWRHDGHAMHHIIDPRRGGPAGAAAISASVYARDGAEAEVLAKLALIAPDRLPPDAALWAFDTPGTVRVSPAMAAALNWTDPTLTVLTEGITR